MVESVVLVHALRTSSTMWRGQRELLERRGVEVITPDLPGHGSRLGERFTVDAAVQTIEAAVADAASPPLLVGFSLGGYLSVHYAGLAERPIAGMLAAGCGTQPTRVVLDGWRALAAIIHRLPDRGLALHTGALRRFVHDDTLVADVNGGGVALDVMDDVLRELRVLDMVGSLRRVQQPVWLVNGQYDHFRLQERRYLRAAPNATLVHIPRATHLVSLTHADAFNVVLLDALAEVAPGPSLR